MYTIVANWYICIHMEVLVVEDEKLQVTWQYKRNKIVQYAMLVKISSTLCLKCFPSSWNVCNSFTLDVSNIRMNTMLIYSSFSIYSWISTRTHNPMYEGESVYLYIQMCLVHNRGGKKWQCNFHRLLI